MAARTVDKMAALTLACAFPAVILALVRPTLDALLALLANAVHARLREAILDAAFARASLVAALASTRAVGALWGTVMSPRVITERLRITRYTEKMTTAASRNTAGVLTATESVIAVTSPVQIKSAR